MAVVRLAMGALALASLPVLGEGTTQPAGNQAVGGYNALVEAYLHGRWAELAEAQKALASQAESLTAAQQDDVAYIAEASAVHRPPWWADCKAKKAATLEVPFFTKSFRIPFRPAAQTGYRYGQRGAWMECTVHWDPNHMDSAVEAGGSLGGRGFPAGVICERNLWAALASAHFVQMTSPKTLREIFGLTGADGRVRGGDPNRQALFQQYMSFTSELTTLYHVAPPARQATMVWCLAVCKLQDQPHLRPRRALAAMLVAAFLEDLSKWPSLTRPELVEAEPERSAARFYHFRLFEPWTLAEDRAMRAAALRFHELNPPRKFLTAGGVTLSNGMTFLMDAEKDAPHLARRDAWVKKQLARTRAPRAESAER